MIYDFNDQIVEPFHQIHDAEPQTTGNHGMTKRAEKARDQEAPERTPRFLLPVHDRPAKIEARRGGRAAQACRFPARSSQTLPQRNWFPA